MWSLCAGHGLGRLRPKQGDDHGSASHNAHIEQLWLDIQLAELPRMW